MVAFVINVSIGLGNNYKSRRGLQLISRRIYNDDD